MISLMPTSKHAPAAVRFDSLEQEVYLNLWRTYDRLKELEDEMFAGQGLTAQQYNALRLLREAAPERIPTLVLAERLISRAPDITRLLDRLEEKQLIDRVRPSGNRRTVMVGITSVGQALLNELQEPVRKCHERQLGHLSPAAMNQLVALLREARKPHERGK
jgi:DNA-binding MarR family transcriptional regulator